MVTTTEHETLAALRGLGPGMHARSAVAAVLGRGVLDDLRALAGAGLVRESGGRWEVAGAAPPPAVELRPRGPSIGDRLVELVERVPGLTVSQAAKELGANTGSVSVAAAAVLRLRQGRAVRLYPRAWTVERATAHATGAEPTPDTDTATPAQDDRVRALEAELAELRSRPDPGLSATAAAIRATERAALWLRSRAAELRARPALRDRPGSAHAADLLVRARELEARAADLEAGRHLVSP